jgi:hypothetical protein
LFGLLTVAQFQNCNNLKIVAYRASHLILMQQQELRQVVRKLCSAVAQLSEFGACYVNNNNDLLEHPDDDNTAPTRLVVPDKL